MNRKKKKVTDLIDRKECENVIRDYSEATSKVKGIESEMEIEIQKIRDQKSQELLDLRTKQEEAMDKLQYFSEFNKEDLFAKRKSIELAHGIIGFRTGTPKVKAVGTSLAKALEAIKMAKLKFVRTKEELDKDKIIASRNDDKVIGKLRAIGLEVVQEETFYVEPKLEEYA